MGRPAAMASNALSGEVWRSVMAVRRNGTATTARARAARRATSRLRAPCPASRRGARGRGARTSARTRPMSASPAMPAQDHQPRRAGPAAIASTSTSTPFQG